MKEKTARIAQVWPASLKEELRERVGHRGMTDFTVAAVREKLFTEQDDEVKERLRAAPGPEVPNIARSLRGRPIENVDLPGQEMSDAGQETSKCATCGASLVDGECWSCF